MQLSTTETAELNNGVAIPRLGLGTWKAKDGDECVRAVIRALEVGYRHIDTAAAYGNEASVGRAIKESSVPREDIFVTSKVKPKDMLAGKVAAAIDATLDKLGFDHVDLYLLHWPVGDIVASWRAMEQVLEQGKARAIGVSNFMQHHLQKLFDATATVPAVNQVECHPRLQQHDLIAFCRDKGVVYEAYSPLMRGDFEGLTKLTDVAEAVGKTPAQVILRWQLQEGLVTIPKSTNHDRIAENFDVFDFELTDAQVQTMRSLETGDRIGSHPDNFKP